MSFLAPRSRTSPSEASAALNVLKSCVTPAPVLWSALQRKAVAASEDVLKFSDGSTLRKCAQGQNYLAA